MRYNTDRRSWRHGPAFSALAFLITACLTPTGARAVDVATETDLRNAIFASNGGGDHTINIVGNITLTQSLPMITANATIAGNGNVLDANNAGRAIFVQSGTVGVSNLTINNALAQGGAGGAVAGGGGGGGLGAGAAVFVNTGASANLSNVSVGNASARGGNGGRSVTGTTGDGYSGGGGGGLGGAGGSGDLTSGAVGGSGGGGYAGNGGGANEVGNGGGGGEFGNGNTGNGGPGGGGGGQQGNGGFGSSSGGGGGGATANGQDGSQGGAGGGAEGGNADGGSARAPLGGGAGSGNGGDGSGGNGGFSGGGGGGRINPGGNGGVGGVGGGGGGGLSGGAGGDFGGGGGAGFAQTSGPDHVGGAGGFGGGGGGAYTNVAGGPGIGGAGGFGAGGGGGGTTGGAGGTLGGQGGSGSTPGGGGGAALGGAIFVRDGGSVTISGGNLAGTYGVTAGTGGGGGATDGQAQGSVMFLQGTGTTSLNIASDTQTLAGNDAVAGSGGLSKSGAGTLALTGANANYTGATTVTGGLVSFATGGLGSGTITLNGGGLQWATGNTSDISGQLAALGASGGTFDTNGNNVTLATAITGTGGLTKSGTGTLTLTGTNSFTSTTINGGTLSIGSASNIGAGAITFDGGTLSFTSGAVISNAIVLNSGGGTIDVGSSSGGPILGGVITGTGTLTKTGSGTVNLAAASSYQGETVVSQGTLVGSGPNFLSANSAFTISSGAFLSFGSDQTIGSLAGDGSVVGLVPTGFTATLTTGGGNANPTTFNGVISDGTSGGTLGLTKTGTGTMTLTGINTYTGATTINAGTLALSGTGSIATSSGVSLGAAGATFDLSQTTSGASAKSLSGSAGTVALGAQTLSITGTGGTFGGVIQDAGLALGLTGGGLTIGDGTTATTQTLTGANTYTGTTTINANATLALSGTGSIAASSSVTMTGGTFDISQTTGGASVKGLSSTGGAGTVSLGDNTLTVTGTGGSFSGTIDDGSAGGALVIGDGTHAASLTLGGNNTYTGATTVKAGSTLFLTGTAAITPTSGVTLSGSGATLDISGMSNAPVVKNLTGDAGTVVTLGAQTMTAASLVDTSFAGVIQGTGGISKQASGALTLAGVNTYSGATSIIGGTLALSGSGSIASSPGVSLVFAGTTFDISQTISGTSVASLLSASGRGTVALGSKTLTLTGNTNATFGGTIQDGGLGSGTHGTLTISDGTNAASQTLSGTNTYTGATTINTNSTLFLSGTGSIATSSGVNLSASGATFDISGTTSGATIQDLAGAAGTTVNLGAQALTAGTGNSTAFGGTIQGTGSLIKTGSGTLTLGGDNTYSGGTALRGGTLAVGSNTALGTGTVTTSSGTTLQAATAVALANAFTLNATLTVDSGANAMTLSGPIGGAGALVKSGSGTLNLTGTNTYGGSTIVGLGTLLVNGSITGGVAVTGLSTLGGSGTIGGSVNVAGAGATVAPGNSIGTLTIGGSYSQDFSSTYQVEVNNSGLSDKLVITGTATLAGTLAVQAQPGKYQRTTTYTILTASGGVTGNFSTLTSSSASLTPSVVVAGTNVTLILLNSAAILPGSDTNSYTGNQGTIATVLNQAGTTITGGDLNTVLNTFSNLTPAQLAPILDAIGGQNYSGFSSIAMQGSQVFMDSFQVQAGGGAGGGGASLPGGSTYQALKVGTGDACDTACGVEPLWGAWGGGLGAFGTVAGDSNSHGLTYTLGGFIAGLDRKFAPGFRAGVAAGFNAATLYTQGMPGTGTSNTLQFALYSEYAPGPFYVDALAGYGHSDNRMNRPIVIPGLPFRMAQGYTTANTFFGQLETGYKVMIAPSFGGFVMPFARLQASTSTQAGFSETGADSLNLTVAQQTTNSLRTVLGAQIGAGIDAPWREKLDLVFRLGWSHEFADQTRPVTAAFAGAPALSFTTFGAQAPRDGVVLGLGVNTQVAERTSLYLRYDGDLAGGNTNHVFNAGVRYVW